MSSTLSVDGGPVASAGVTSRGGREAIPGAHYDSVASEYAAFIGRSATDQVFGYEPLLQVLGSVNGKRVLDYGCGPGTFSRQLAENGAHVVGVDISAQSIAEAKGESAPSQVSFHAIRSGDLSPVGGQHFDSAVSCYVFCTMSDQKQMVEILRGIRERLKPGGSLHLLESNWERGNGRDFVSFALPRIEPLTSGTPVTAILKGTDGAPDLPVRDYFWSRDDYANMLRAAGFVGVSTNEPRPMVLRSHWRDELTHAPTMIISARNPSQPQPAVDAFGDL